jgi:hypothetical protein
MVIRERVGSFCITSLFIILLAATPCMAVPMIITNGNYADEAGNDISLSGITFNLSVSSNLEIGATVFESITIPIINVMVPSGTQITGMFTATSAYLEPIMEGFDSVARMTYGLGTLTYTSENYYIDISRGPIAQNIDVTSLEMRINFVDYVGSGYGSGNMSFTAVRASSVPEPGTLFLLMSGIAGLVAGRKILLG